MTLSSLVRSAIALGTAAVVVTGPWPGPPASASCASPYLQVAEDSAAPPVLGRGDRVTVEGRAFVDGCDDTGAATAWGCSTDEGESEQPMRDVQLRLRQGGRTWQLGSEDAGTTDDNRLGQISWRVTVPHGVQPGPATLVADSSGPLQVRVE